MSAAVIDDLVYTRHKDDVSVGIAYLYCDFRRHYEQKTQDLVASLLKQLIQKQTRIPDCVQAFYDKYNKESRRPSLDELSEILRSVSSLYSKVFILIDALDECQDTDGCRKNLLSRIFHLQKETNINIFATSRFIQDIVDTFNESICFEISAKDEDVQSYLDSHMTRLPSFVLRSPDLQNEIKAKICQLSDGMWVICSEPFSESSYLSLINCRFLLVRLHVDSLAQMPTVGHIRQALRNLPRSLSKIYEQSIERIGNQGEFLHQLARKVIVWLIHAKRVLSMAELRHAVAIQPGTLELDEEFIPDREILASICAGLVTYDAESDVLRLAHYTIQEYFEGEGSSWVQDAETVITTACVTYLSFRTFESGIYQDEREHRQRLASNPLYNYAANHWGLHALASLETQPILDFLNSELKVSTATQELIKEQEQSFRYSSSYDHRGIHLAVYFGLENIVTNLLENGHDPNVGVHTPLIWAIREGHQGMVKLLIRYGAQVDAQNLEEQSPLSEAVICENEDIIKLLLENGADTEATDDWRLAPLHHASQIEHEKFAKVLLENGAEVNVADDFHKTPLHYACDYGHTNVAKLLLANGAKINAIDYEGQTPLLFACHGEKEDIVKLLLKHGAKIDAAAKDGETVLMAAACSYIQDEATANSIVKLLLEHGAEINAADKHGHTALMKATDSKSPFRKVNFHIIKLLLEHGAAINAADIDGRTPLIWAAEAGKKDGVRLLLENGAEIDAADKSGKTALFWANIEGQTQIVKLLLEHGADAKGINVI